MLLYTLDELFYIYDQVKHHRGIDKKLVVAYEILSLAALHCMERWGWVERTSMLDALPLVNLKDTCHLECFAWPVYDGALLMGSHPELPGECQWCTMLAGIFKHIYKGHDKMAHCPLYTLASWDCQQRMEVACEEHRQNALCCRHDDGHRARAWRSRSGSRCHSRKEVDQIHLWFPTNTPPLRYPSVGELFSSSSDTTPKLSSAVSVPAYARSSHSAGGVAQALLDDDEDKEEDFQTPHTPVLCMVR